MPPDEEECRPHVESGTHKIDPGEKIISALESSEDRTRVLREHGYSLSVIEGVIRWNRMRAAGVRWEPEPIRYPKPDGPIVYPKQDREAA
jgi:hypothetical protein